VLCDYRGAINDGTRLSGVSRWGDGYKTGVGSKDERHWPPSLLRRYSFVTGNVSEGAGTGWASSILDVGVTVSFADSGRGSVGPVPGKRESHNTIVVVALGCGVAQHSTG
jgi:hypothetical protein